MNKWPRIIQEWFYPPTCLLCSAAGIDGLDLCGGCKRDLPYNRDACPKCGIPLPNAGLSACGPCAKMPPATNSTLALFRYEEPIRTLIRELKFSNRYACARLFAELLAPALANAKPIPEVLIAVPLRRQRLIERGYNQSEEIARNLAKKLAIPLASNLCERVRNTSPQTQLPAVERNKNLKNCFRVVGSPRKYRHVAILDDVITTAATVNELARTLKKSGVERVDVYAVARA